MVIQKHIQRYSILLSLVLPVILMLFSPSGKGIESENCRMNLVNEVEYSISSKAIESGSQNEIIKSSIPVNSINKKGHLDICLDKKGICLWTLKGAQENDHVIALAGMEEVVTVLRLALSNKEKSLESYIGMAKEKNAQIIYLGNGTCSVRHNDKLSGMTSVSLIDLSRNMLLGSSIYNSKNELQTKLVCKYKNSEKRTILNSTSLFYFQMEEANSTLTLTEIVSKYN